MLEAHFYFQTFSVLQDVPTVRMWDTYYTNEPYITTADMYNSSITGFKYILI